MENNFIINPDDKFFPSADEWMWDYCTFLGKFTDSKGDNYDLGILLEGNIKGQWSAAIVYGNTPGNYISGSRFMFINSENEIRDNCENESIIEMIRRSKILNLIK